MLKKILNSRHKNNKENWTAEKWYDYLLKEARSQSEKDELHAMFNRDIDLHTTSKFANK